MIRQSIVNAVKPALRSSASIQTRTITVTAARMAEGDTGATPSGGAASADSFQKREKANEDFFVKSKEREKLKALREKVAMQQKHLKELEDHIDDMSKEGGGEKN